MCVRERERERERETAQRPPRLERRGAVIQRGSVTKLPEVVPPPAFHLIQGFRVWGVGFRG